MMHIALLSIGSGAKNDLARHAVTKPYAAGDGSKEIKINVFVCNNAKQFFDE
jgi:urease accessory protein UreH